MNLCNLLKDTPEVKEITSLSLGKGREFGVCFDIKDNEPIPITGIISGYYTHIDLPKLEGENVGCVHVHPKWAGYVEITPEDIVSEINDLRDWACVVTFEKNKPFINCVEFKNKQKIKEVFHNLKPKLERTRKEIKRIKKEIDEAASSHRFREYWEKIDRLGELQKEEFEIIDKMKNRMKPFLDECVEEIKGVEPKYSEFIEYMKKRLKGRRFKSIGEAQKEFGRIAREFRKYGG